VPPEHAAAVHPGGGILRATAIADGQAVGTWSLRRRAGGVDVRVAPFAGLPPTVARALDDDAADVARFHLAAPRP
jgi:hypothetical protein